uniref:Uncharacterized protein n=1 Tax=Kalanchoe fedtschenkoi TaxID=63787 RepID=A0A7N1A1P0_KALFE
MSTTHPPQVEAQSNSQLTMSSRGSHKSSKLLDLQEDEKEQLKEVVKNVAIVAGIGLGAYLLGSWFSSGPRKTMKAPGRDIRIFRDDFEADPSKYFRDLRKP